jgi:DNA-binding FrmR family transcriptional regulator
MALCARDRKRLMDRIHRIEGQVRGIEKMVETDRGCFEVLKQIAACLGALRALGMAILEEHLKGCVSEAIRKKGRDERLIDEVVEVFNKFSR